MYDLDTVANVQDERCGVSGPMWVQARTLRKSRQGTFTDLKLIPANALVMGYYLTDQPPPPPPPTYPAARAVQKVEPDKVTQGLAPVWFRIVDDSTGKLL